jgi:phage baseplate assembly protein W
MHIAYPFRIANDNCTAVSDTDQHINELIQQVLLTAPGERVNQPTFGSGLLSLAFSPDDSNYAPHYQSLIQSALQQWLGDLIQIQSLEVVNEDATLQFNLQYLVLTTQEQKVAQFDVTV